MSPLGLLQDPEGILAAPKAGHISRRFIAKQAEQNEELKEQMNKAREEARKELSEKREVSLTFNSRRHRSCIESSRWIWRCLDDCRRKLGIDPCLTDRVRH